MTIRYTCVKCESVLKIRDEKAGTKAKCPKCRNEFIVPAPADEDSGIEIDDAPGEATPASSMDDDLVDMPIDLTPEVDLHAHDDNFDPMDVLSGSTAGVTPTASSAGKSAAEPVKKPSVAELMREFEATKKKDAPKAADLTAAKPSAHATAGSAADMLSRVYEQKREKAGQPKQKEVDPEIELRNQFLKKAGAALAGAAVVIYAFFAYLNREIYTGPPLASVSGTVSSSNGPLVGVRIQFLPALTSLDGSPIAAPAGAGASGITDAQGKYFMSYDATNAGAPVGDHEVKLIDATGLPMPPLSGEFARFTVQEGSNTFDIKID
ncbi:MAG: hypothetical protein KDA85_20795 [Planctomycetaceae bacterium]|nr:hypothetical protein [Planctomycetaceae bacterium]